MTLDVYVCNYGGDNSDKARALLGALIGMIVGALYMAAGQLRLRRALKAEQARAERLQRLGAHRQRRLALADLAFTQEYLGATASTTARMSSGRRRPGA